MYYIWYCRWHNISVSLGLKQLNIWLVSASLCESIRSTHAMIHCTMLAVWEPYQHVHCQGIGWRARSPLCQIQEALGIGRLWSESILTRQKTKKKQKAYSVVLDSFVSPRYTIIHINTYIYIYMFIYTDLHGIEMYRIIKYLMYFLSTHIYIFFFFYVHIIYI